MAWVTWRQHRSQLVAGLGLLVALAARRARHAPADRRRRTTATRSRPACRRRRARAATSSSGTSRASSTAGSRRCAASPCCRRSPASSSARRCSRASSSTAPTASRGRRASRAGAGCSRRRRCSPPATVVAGGASRARVVMWWRSPFDTLEGRIGAERLRHRGRRRARRTRSSRSRSACSPGSSSGGRVAAMTATLVAFVATRLARPRRSCGRTSCAPLHRAVVGDRRRPRRRGDWVLSDTLVDAGGRQITRRPRGPRGPARAAGRHRPAHVPRHARLEARRLVPAGRPLLDVPAHRGGPLRRARRRASSLVDALARPPDADMSGGARPRARCSASPPPPPRLRAVPDAAPRRSARSASRSRTRAGASSSSTTR